MIGELLKLRKGKRPCLSKRRAGAVGGGQNQEMKITIMDVAINILGYQPTQTRKPVKISNQGRRNEMRAIVSLVVILVALMALELGLTYLSVKIKDRRKQ